MDSFYADDLSRLKLARVCQRSTRTCLGFCTIVIHHVESEVKAIANWPLTQPLNLETATYYATIPINIRSELEYKKLETNYLRSLLLKYFGASPPRLHMLPPNLADFSKLS